jgi:hypothetical protein
MNVNAGLGKVGSKGVSILSDSSMDKAHMCNYPPDSRQKHSGMTRSKGIAVSNQRHPRMFLSGIYK